MLFYARNMIQQILIVNFSARVFAFSFGHISILFAHTNLLSLFDMKIILKFIVRHVMGIACLLCHVTFFRLTMFGEKISS